MMSRPVITFLGDPDETWKPLKMQIITSNTKNPSSKVTFLGSSPPFVIGDYQFWENEETSELWKRKFDGDTGNNGEWKKTNLFANDFR